MDYIIQNINKEFKSNIFNKKTLLISICAFLFIFIVLLKNWELCDPTGFHSVLWNSYLLIFGYTFQFLPQGYYLEKENGVENLLKLSNKLKSSLNFKIVYYSIINLFLMTFLFLVFKFFFNYSIFYNFTAGLYNYFNCIILTMLDIELLLLINDKVLSTYISLAFMLGYTTVNLQIFDVLFPLIGNMVIYISLLLIIILKITINITIKLEHKLFLD